MGAVAATFSQPRNVYSAEPCNLIEKVMKCFPDALFNYGGSGVVGQLRTLFERLSGEREAVFDAACRGEQRRAGAAHRRSSRRHLGAGRHKSGLHGGRARLSHR